MWWACVTSPARYTKYMVWFSMVCAYSCPPTWTDAALSTATLQAIGTAQEQHIRHQMGKLRWVTVHRSGYFYTTVKGSQR